MIGPWSSRTVQTTPMISRKTGEKPSYHGRRIWCILKEGTPSGWRTVQIKGIGESMSQSPVQDQSRYLCCFQEQICEVNGQLIYSHWYEDWNDWQGFSSGLSTRCSSSEFPHPQESFILRKPCADSQHYQVYSYLFEFIHFVSQNFLNTQSDLNKIFGTQPKIHHSFENN